MLPDVDKDLMKAASPEKTSGGSSKQRRRHYHTAADPLPRRDANPISNISCIIDRQVRPAETRP